MNNYYSISQNPSSFGKFFYNYFFNKYNLNSTYTPLKADLNTFSSLLQDLIKNKAAGISISMPFKRNVIRYLDKLDNSVKNFNSCNTITILDNQSMGFNTDIKGIEYVSSLINSTSKISILGMGCMGSMFSKYLNSYNTRCYSRSLNNFSSRHDDCDVVINCTALGTINNLSPLNYIPKSTSLVIDLSVKENELERMCKRNNVNYISGLEFYKHQFLEQFKIYTGICLSNEELDLATRVLKNDR